MDTLEGIHRGVQFLPLVTITTISRPQGGRTLNQMGFVYERYPNGVLLIATTRHLVSRLLKKEGSHTHIGSAYGKQEMTMLGSPIADPEGETDLLFFLVRDEERLFMKLFLNDGSDPPVPEGSVLFNAHNSSTTVGNSTIAPVGLARHTAVEEHKKTFYFRFSAGLEKARVYEWGDDRASAAFISGWIPHRIFTMACVGGFSGSATWDSYYRLIGMHIGGSDNEHRPKRGERHHAICLPASVLAAARKRIEPQLQEQLSRIPGAPP